MKFAMKVTATDTGEMLARVESLIDKRLYWSWERGEGLRFHRTLRSALARIGRMNG